MVGVADSIQGFRGSAGTAAIPRCAGTFSAHTGGYIEPCSPGALASSGPSCTPPAPKSYSSLAIWPGLERWRIAGLSQPGCLSLPDSNPSSGTPTTIASPLPGCADANSWGGICPTRRVLNCDVQIPRAAGLGDLNASAHSELDLKQGDLELQDAGSCRRILPSESTRNRPR